MAFILSFLCITASIVISALLVLAQKMLFTIHFEWPFLLTLVDYFFLFIILLGISYLKKIQIPKNGDKKTILMISIINFASAVCWIINIQRNSICLCQISRLYINPVIALYTIIRGNRSFSIILLLISIILLFAGTFIFISNEFQFVPANLIYSVIYIVFSSLARIFNPSFQRENRISNTLEFHRRIILYELVLSCVSAIYMEVYRTRSFDIVRVRVNYYQMLFFWIFVPLTCLKKCFQFLVFDKLPQLYLVLIDLFINSISAISGIFLFLPIQAESELTFLKRILGYLFVFLGSVIISLFIMKPYESKYDQLYVTKLPQKDQNGLQLDQKFLTV